MEISVEATILEKLKYIYISEYATQRGDDFHRRR